MMTLNEKQVSSLTEDDLRAIITVHAAKIVDHKFMPTRAEVGLLKLLSKARDGKLRKTLYEECNDPGSLSKHARHLVDKGFLKIVHQPNKHKYYPAYGNNLGE